jgi:hypothetical protein
MKKTLLVLAAFAMSMAAMAQFYVYKDGDIVYKVLEGAADSVVLKGPKPYSGDGMESSRGYADLGLLSGTMWATCNVGASNPQEYGDFFAWGETQTKSKYDYDNYKYFNSTTYQITKYSLSDNKTELEAADDVARVKWGGKWTMPTAAQMTELVNQCYWVWTKNYNESGVAGYIVFKAKSVEDKGSVVDVNSSLSLAYSLSDTHIFLPAVGYKDSYQSYLGEAVCYWTKTLDDEDEYYGIRLYAEYYSGNELIRSIVRFSGMSVRPVFN